MKRAVLIATLLLAGCQQPAPEVAEVEAVDPICQALSGGSSHRDKANDCIHRQGYRLATGPDAADIVAKAVVAACRSEITSALLDQVAEENQGGALGDAAGTRVMHIRQSYEEKALVRVAEGRAGKCPA